MISSLLEKRTFMRGPSSSPELARRRGEEERRGRLGRDAQRRGNGTLLRESGTRRFSFLRRRLSPRRSGKRIDFKTGRERGVVWKRVINRKKC